MFKNTLRFTLATASVLAALSSSFAAETAPQDNANDKLMIVNGSNGHVIYDDGRDDLYCVTRRHFAGYDRYGNPMHSRSMRCR